MAVYEFYYKEILLGHLHICDGQHRYVPIAENVDRAKQEVPLDREMIQGREWGKPIPFFQERIENAARFGRENCIRYHTDLFLLHLVSE